EYTATIHVRSKLHYFKLIKNRLNEDRRTLFRTTCFGPWLDITYVENNDGRIHYVLQKQCFSDDDSFDLPLIYNINGHGLHFVRREFCLVTAFKFGFLSFREYRNGDIPFCNRLFPKKIGYDVKIIDVLALLEDEEKFSKVSDEDAIRVCLLLSLEVIFMGRDPYGAFGSAVNAAIRVRLKLWISALRGRLVAELQQLRKGREDALIDCVRDLEDICKTLLTLPKEVKSLRGRIFKLESIIHVSLYPTCGFGKEETLKKVGLQIEDFLQTTSKDEPDIKDDTSSKEVVYCCDDNGDAPLCFMLAKHVREGDCEHYKYTYSSKQEDQIIQLADQRQQDDISNMAEVDEQKIQFEIQSAVIILLIVVSGMVCVVLMIIAKDSYLTSCYFLQLLLQGSMPLFYANSNIYPVAWSNVERVFIPINEPKRHWSLAMFHICSGIVTFYDSEDTHDFEFRTWYLKMRECLEEKLHVVLKETDVFEKKYIDPTKYKISFWKADHVSKQGGDFGDCGVFLLTYGVPLAVNDPLQTALAYREKMIRFYFQHKMFCP
ncbi:phospholipase-like, aminotransferase-like mobile domain protein, partial [Tanacetum coccineum]